MPPYDTLARFLVAVVVFAVTPGPAVFYIVTRSLGQGRRSGVISALAVASGNLVHVAAAVVGLSALLASSAVAFTVVKYLGAAYLIYLGIRTLLQRGDDDPRDSLLRAEAARLAARPSMREWLNRTRQRSSDLELAELLTAIDEQRGPWPDAGR